MTIITIHQPDFLPWLGFFDRWRKSDAYVMLDDVQYIRRGWQHRDRIKTQAGESWLTVPVVKKGRYEQQIRNTRIDNGQDWRTKQLRQIHDAYGKAPFFEQIYQGLQSIYERGHEFLLELNRNLLEWCAGLLGIDAPILLASDYDVSSTKTQRLVDLMLAVEGDVYFTGQGSRAYLDEDAFSRRGIRVLWHDMKHPVYPQLHGPFVPNLSVLDYLMMQGAGALPTMSSGTDNQNETVGSRSGERQGNTSCCM